MRATWPVFIASVFACAHVREGGAQDSKDGLARTTLRDISGHRLDPALTGLQVRIITPREEVDAVGDPVGFAVTTEGPCAMQKVSFGLSDKEIILREPPWIVELPRAFAMAAIGHWWVEAVDQCGHGVYRKITTVE